jgi:hypothetical protein
MMDLSEKLTTCHACPDRQGTRCTRHASPYRDVARRTLRPCPRHVEPPRQVSHGQPDGEIDVVIPYCPADARWLAEAVDSIRRQTVRSVIHVVSDGGDQNVLDGLPDGVRCYVNLDAPIGPYRSVHRVWRWLATPYVAIQDADDISLPFRLERSLHFLQKGADLVAGEMAQFVDPHHGNGQLAKTRAEKPTLRSGVEWSTAPKGCIIHGVTAYARAAFEAVNGYTPWLCGADNEFGPRLQASGYLTAFPGELWGLRRLHAGSMTARPDTGMKSRMRARNRDELIRRIAAFHACDFSPRQYGGLDQDAESDRTERIQ